MNIVCGLVWEEHSYDFIYPLVKCFYIAVSFLSFFVFLQEHRMRLGQKAIFHLEGTLHLWMLYLLHCYVTFMDLQ